MSGILTLRSPHFSGEIDRAAWQLDAVGLKAIGLGNLPVDWTPEFIVITAEAFSRWQNPESRGELFDTLAVGIAPILGLESGRLIVRSSASAESIDCRGWLESVLCEPTYTEVFTAADRVWGRAKATPNIASSGFGAVVQRFRSPKLHGHLSNERRVSRNRNVWLCEVESPMAVVETKAIRFRANMPSPTMEPASLLCSDRPQLIERLKHVADWCLARKNRHHLEWVWDGERLWIVQLDVDEEIRGNRPSCSPIPLPLLNIQPPRLKLFCKSNEASGWKKIESLRLLAEAGLKVADLYVLQNASVLSELGAGKASNKLKSDLSALVESPIVFRTDFLTDGNMPKLLSARSHTLSTLEEATAWLLEKSERIVSQGVKPGEFCFIGHRYIPARSGAICLARPDSPLVRIDAIWGFPDGLLCYPHDTFQLSRGGLGEIDRRTRCKPFCLSTDARGEWVPNRCPAPWDWRPCLQDSEIREIARMSSAVAVRLKQAVEVMYFVGVDERTGYPKILPWIHFEDTPTDEEEADGFHYAGKSFTITNDADLKRLETSIVEARKTDNVAIHLRPALSLLRSKEFVEAVAEAALHLNVPVQLEGSVLSHIYYMLAKVGVKVRCVDAVAALRRHQRFGKLVRDLIDVKIRAGGEIARTFRVPKDELIRLLKAKALEEAFELFRAEDPKLAFDELVDIFEVVLGACKAYGRSFEELAELAEIKRRERGGFEKGIVLIETEAVPLFGDAPSDPGLFGKSESAGDPNGKRQRKLKNKPYVRCAPRGPRVRGREITIPMIPPQFAETNMPTIVSLPDGEHEAVVRYLGSVPRIPFL